MNKYIGTKLIEAEKATLAEAQALKTGACDTIEEARKRFGGSDDGNPGYVVKYPDGYISWSPKDVLYAGSGESETDIWRINRRTHGE